jgi:hypothetical protein
VDIDDLLMALTYLDNELEEARTTLNHYEEQHAGSINAPTVDPAEATRTWVDQGLEQSEHQQQLAWQMRYNNLQQAQHEPRPVLPSEFSPTEGQNRIPEPVQTLGEPDEAANQLLAEILRRQKATREREQKEHKDALAAEEGCRQRRLEREKNLARPDDTQAKNVTRPAQGSQLNPGRILHQPLHQWKDPPPGNYSYHAHPYGAGPTNNLGQANHQPQGFQQRASRPAQPPSRNTRWPNPLPQRKAPPFAPQTTNHQFETHFQSWFLAEQRLKSIPLFSGATDEFPAWLQTARA